MKRDLEILSRVVSQVFGVSSAYWHTSSKLRRYTRVRAAFIFLALENGANNTEVGKFLGREISPHVKGYQGYRQCIKYATQNRFYARLLIRADAEYASAQIRRYQPTAHKDHR